jgi:hypothetical protein
MSDNGWETEGRATHQHINTYAGGIIMHIHLTAVFRPGGRR